MKFDERSGHPSSRLGWYGVTFDSGLKLKIFVDNGKIRNVKLPVNEMVSLYILKDAIDELALAFL